MFQRACQTPAVTVYSHAPLQDNASNAHSAVQKEEVHSGHVLCTGRSRSVFERYSVYRHQWRTEANLAHEMQLESIWTTSGLGFGLEWWPSIFGDAYTVKKFALIMSRCLSLSRAHWQGFGNAKLGIRLRLLLFPLQHLVDDADMTASNFTLQMLYLVLHFHHTHLETNIHHSRLYSFPSPWSYLDCAVSFWKVVA